MMTELTSKQKKQLRSLGQRIDAAAAVGKAGLTPAFVRTVSELLAQHELLKVHIPPGSAEERAAAADELAHLTDSQPIAVVGRMALAYRPNPSLPPKHRIEFS